MAVSSASLDLVRSVMEKALHSQRGVKVSFNTHGKAIQFRQQCYTARSKDRQLTKKIYGEDDPRYGRSSFDGLVVTIYPIDETEYEVRVEPSSLLEIKVEEI